jgi:hypothetical protein
MAAWPVLRSRRVCRLDAEQWSSPRREMPRRLLGATPVVPRRAYPAARSEAARAEEPQERCLVQMVAVAKAGAGEPAPASQRMHARPLSQQKAQHHYPAGDGKCAFYWLIAVARAGLGVES